MTAPVLVPLDGSPEAALALALGQVFAQAYKTDLLLVRVSAPGADGAASAHADLEAMAEQVHSVPVSTAVVAGEPSPTICKVAQERGARLVVMETHGRSGLDRVLVGSVAEGVLTHSRVPVVLQRPGGKPITGLKTILVPVDGTPGGSLALSQAVELARSTGARLVLIEVAIPISPWAMTDVYGMGTYVDPAWDDEALDSARGYVEGLARRLTKTGLTVETKAVLHGSVHSALGEAANEVDADLIVMSTHALTGPARTVLGSVADSLVRETHRPVLLVRRDKHEHSAA